MQRYFENMLPVEELRQLKYFPTIADCSAQNKHVV